MAVRHPNMAEVFFSERRLSRDDAAFLRLAIDEAPLSLRSTLLDQALSGYLRIRAQCICGDPRCYTVRFTEEEPMVLTRIAQAKTGASDDRTVSLFMDRDNHIVGFEVI